MLLLLSFLPFILRNLFSWRFWCSRGRIDVFLKWLWFRRIVSRRVSRWLWNDRRFEMIYIQIGSWWRVCDCREDNIWVFSAVSWKRKISQFWFNRSFWKLFHNVALGFWFQILEWFWGRKLTLFLCMMRDSFQLLLFLTAAQTAYFRSFCLNFKIFLRSK